MDVKMQSIDAIGLCVRSSNALHRAGVHTVGDMLERTEEVYEGEGFGEEMLVICNLTDAQMDQMLAYFRKEGIRIALKAALTPTNMSWSSIELHDELVREHEAVQRQIRERREQKAQKEQKKEQ